MDRPSYRDVLLPIRYTVQLVLVDDVQKFQGSRLRLASDIEGCVASLKPNSLSNFFNNFPFVKEIRRES